MTISQNILQFNEILSHQEPKVPNGFRIINPFIGENKDKINKMQIYFIINIIMIIITDTSY